MPESPVVIESLKRKEIDLNDHHPAKKSKKGSKSLELATLCDALVTPNLARKKSVTFTPETKIEDGDSIKQLFGAWVAEQKSQDPAFQPRSRKVFSTPDPSIIEEHIDPNLDEKERRVKRVKGPEFSPDQSNSTAKPNKSKSPKLSKVTNSIKAPARPFLQYLKQYHESRDTWKFNKNHQNYLVKHIFEVKIIPSDHAHLIYEYVRGLQGGVRTRLRDAAFAIKVKDQEDGAAGFPITMADRDKKQVQYDAAMEEYVATMTAVDASKKMGYEEGVLLGLSDAAMGDRVVKRLRAEQILAELASGDGNGEEVATATPGPQLTYDDDIQQRIRMNNGSSQKIIRKRKQRTTAVDDETSSSDDSSVSESTSSDQDSESSSKLHEPIENSSSSSSSSSSDSEDEDREDEEGDDDEESSDESDSD
jgi:hypothetical protein